MVNVNGKWAFITGAARGIGYLTALFLADQGCNLVLHGRTKAHCEKVLNEVKAKGVQAYAVEAEFTNMDQVKAMLQEIDSLNVRIDFVANNAGMQVAYRNDYCNTPVEDYEKSFAINTIAPALIMYHFLPKMKEYGFGRILNTTSGIRLDPQQAGYSASKAALDKITIDLGSTVQGTDVMINLTDPGWCRTVLAAPMPQTLPNPPFPVSW